MHFFSKSGASMMQQTRRSLPLHQKSCGKEEEARRARGAGSVVLHNAAMGVSATEGSHNWDELDT